MYAELAQFAHPLDEDKVKDWCLQPQEAPRLKLENPGGGKSKHW